MTQPKRIQMTRTKPWRADNPDAVIVDRRTEWGNPFAIGDPGIQDARTAVEMFAAAITLCDHLNGLGHWLGPTISDELNGIPMSKTIRSGLRGKDLACRCPLDAPCHADILLKVANA